MVADGLGFELDDISETIEPVIADETVKTEFLEVAPGQVAGVHQIARGTAGGKEKIYMELKMYVGANAARRYNRIERRAESRAHNSRRHAWRCGHGRRRGQCDSCGARCAIRFAHGCAILPLGFFPPDGCKPMLPAIRVYSRSARPQHNPDRPSLIPSPRYTSQTQLQRQVESSLLCCASSSASRISLCISRSGKARRKFVLQNQRRLDVENCRARHARLHHFHQFFARHARAA